MGCIAPHGHAAQIQLELVAVRPDQAHASIELLLADPVQCGQHQLGQLGLDASLTGPFLGEICTQRGAIAQVGPALPVGDIVVGLDHQGPQGPHQL